MKRADNPAVELPEKITFKKGANGTVYVYKTLRAYRDAKGRPTSDEAAIGKLSGDGRLIPNARYYDLHPDALYPQKSVAECQNFGALVVCVN